MVSESRVTWAMPILPFLGLSVLDVARCTRQTDRQTSDAHHRLIPPTLGAGAYNNTEAGHFTNVSNGVYSN